MRRRYLAVVTVFLLIPVGCNDLPTEEVPPVDTLEFVLWVAEETSAILNSGPNAVHENRAIQSLLAIGGQLVSVSLRFTAVIGRTFAWDSAAGVYEPDDTRRDAPVDGTRFILYDAEPNDRTLRFPLIETGHVDVVPEGIGHRVRMVVGGATVLDFIANGALLGNDSLPCCEYGILGAFPRSLSAVGSITLSETVASFSYVDTIIGSTSYTDDLRHLQMTLPARGTVDFRSVVGTALQFLDADSRVELRVAFPTQEGDDSVFVVAGLSGIRSGLGIDSLMINGQSDLLSKGYCEIEPDVYDPCYKYRGTQIDSPQIRALNDAIVTSSGPINEPSYCPFGVLEAMLAPAIFALR